jgi:hypothetical protein
MFFKIHDPVIPNDFVCAWCVDGNFNKCMEGCKRGKVMQSFDIEESTINGLNSIGLILAEFDQHQLGDLASEMSGLIRILWDQGTLRNFYPEYIDALIKINNTIVQGLNNHTLQKNFICYSYF